MRRRMRMKMRRRMRKKKKKKKKCQGQDCVRCGRGVEREKLFGGISVLSSLSISM